MDASAGNARQVSAEPVVIACWRWRSDTCKRYRKRLFALIAEDSLADGKRRSLCVESEMWRLEAQGCTWCRRSSIFAFGVLAVLTMGCARDEPNPLPAASEPMPVDSVTGAEDKSTSNSDEPLSPNTAVLEWDAVNHPNLRGYRVYYGPDKRMYLQLRGRGIDVGNVTKYSVTGLADRRRYDFAVTAYDKWYSESDYSNEVVKDIP